MALAVSLKRRLTPIGLVKAEGPDRVCKGVVLAVTVEESAQDNWCWAAVAKGIAYAYRDIGPQWEQCQVAGRVRKVPCCPIGRYGDCDRPDKLPPALAAHFGGFVAPQDDKQFPLVEASIDTGYPLAVRLGFPDADSGHFVVISGYCFKGDIPHLYVCDPDSGLRTVENFAEFVLRFKHFGAWDRSYRTTGAAPVPRET